MSTNADVITELENAKDALQTQADAASGAQVPLLMSAIHTIEDEIGAIEAKALNGANYVPATNPFQKGSDDADAFISQLKNLKSTFSEIDAVANALDTVAGLVDKM